MEKGIISGYKVDMEEVDSVKDEIALADGKSSVYIKRKVREENELWWKTWREMMESEDKLDRRSAFAEYNKLQCRILPSQLDDGDGNGIVLNIVNYANANPKSNRLIIDSEIKNKKDEHNDTV